MALPTNLFDENWYLARNPDVAEAIEAGLISSAFEHFNLYGKFEGRAPGPLFNPEEYLAANADVRAAVEERLTTAYDHFVNYGASEDRSPLSLFDPEFYLSQNPDVRAAVEQGLITATEHFLLYGQNEPRQINPFINLGDYVGANPDLQDAVAAGGFSPLNHLLTYGASEDRDLGNGINLSIFADDPKFQDAIESGNFQAALERVAEVAPFLPAFEPPANWEPAADTPIPTDFTPPEGTKLVVPPSVVVPDDMELPDTFEPVEPEDPVDPEEPVDPEDPVDPEEPVDPEDPVDPDPGTKPVPETFKVKVDAEGVLSFVGKVRGDITVEFDGDTAKFKRGSKSDEVDFSKVKEVKLKATDTLVLTPEQMKKNAITTTGEGGVKVSFTESDGPQDLEANEDTNIKHLIMDVDDAHVHLPANKDANVLVYSDDFDGDTSLKTLSINASGYSTINLGNETDPSIGYFLGEVNVTGGEEGDFLRLENLYFGKENTRFDSKGFAGNVVLDAYIYNGRGQGDFGGDAGYKWTINFGNGDDVLLLNAAGSGNYPGKYGSWIDGGDGRNTLVLLPNEEEGQPDVYQQWANPDMTWVPEGFEFEGKPIVSNFQTLATNAAQDRVYESNLLGNEFDELILFNSADTAVGVTISEGFKEVYIVGPMDVDASALKGGKASIYVGFYPQEEGADASNDDVSIKIADLDIGANNKSDLDGDRKSDMTIEIADLGAFVGRTISIENMTISATAGYTRAPITNDVIRLGGFAVDEDEFDLAAHVKTFTVKKGADRADDDWYVDFVLKIDLDGDFGTVNDVLTFSLENVVGRGVFNNMLKALDTVKAKGLENTLALVDFNDDWTDNGDFFSNFNLAKNSEQASREFSWNGESAQQEVLVGLVGILVDEGSLEIIEPSFM